MLDVRDQLNIPNKNMFNKTNARICFIACSKKIYKLLTNDFNFQIIYSPPECNDVSLSSLYAIKTSNYFVYGHGLDSKRDETKLLKVAKTNLWSQAVHHRKIAVCKQNLQTIISIRER